MEYTQKTQLKLCIALNMALLTFIGIALSFYSNIGTGYMRFGPNADLEILSLKIDTWTKYIIFQAFIAIIVMTDVYIGEIAGPILGFTVYNPDKKNITEFSRMELQLYANGMFIITSLRSVLMVIVSISQIDIAILKVVYGELMSLYTIRSILLGKIFNEDIEQYQPIQTTENSLNIEIATMV